MKMNKKADGEILLIMLIFIAGVFWIVGLFASTNPYLEFMKDCKQVNNDKFNHTSLIECLVIENCSYTPDYNLTEYCQDKWSKIEIKSNEEKKE